MWKAGLPRQEWRGRWRGTRLPRDRAQPGLRGTRLPGRPAPAPAGWECGQGAVGCFASARPGKGRGKEGACTRPARGAPVAGSVAPEQGGPTKCTRDGEGGGRAAARTRGAGTRVTPEPASARGPALPPRDKAAGHGASWRAPGPGPPWDTPRRHDETPVSYDPTRRPAAC